MIHLNLNISNKFKTKKMKTSTCLAYFISGILLFNACSGPSNLTRDEANIRKAYAAIMQKDFTAFAALCSADYTELALSPEPIKGIEASIAQYKVFLDAFPDTKFEIQSIVPAGPNRYFLQIHLTGTNTGNFMNFPATNKKIDVQDMDIITLNAEGKCNSHWSANPNASLSQIGYGFLNNPNTMLVTAAYEAFGKGDIPGLLALCNDDITFEIHDRTFDSKIRTFKGKEEVSKFFTELNGKIKYSKFQPSRFLADGDDVFIKVDVNYTNASNKKNYSDSYAHQFKATNGKLSYFKGMDGMAVEIKN